MKDNNLDDIRIKSVRVFIKYNYLTDSDLWWIFNEYKKILREELSKKFDMKYKKLPLKIVKIKSESPLDIEFALKLTSYLYQIIGVVVTLYKFYEILNKVNNKFREKEEAFRKKPNIIEAKFG